MSKISTEEAKKLLKQFKIQNPELEAAISQALDKAFAEGMDSAEAEFTLKRVTAQVQQGRETDI